MTSDIQTHFKGTREVRIDKSINSLLGLLEGIAIDDLAGNALPADWQLCGAPVELAECAKPYVPAATVGQLCARRRIGSRPSVGNLRPKAAIARARHIALLQSFNFGVQPGPEAVGWSDLLCSLLRFTSETTPKMTAMNIEKTTRWTLAQSPC